MKPTQKDLIDTDGENRAVRAFLLGREVGCKDYEQMRRHMTNSGFDNCWPSEFASLGGHMSKAAQQMWLRHLFALERFGAGGGEPVAWIYWHPSDDTFDGPDTIHKKAVSRFTDDTRLTMQRKGWRFEPLYTRPSNTDLRAEYLRGLEDAKQVALGADHMGSVNLKLMKNRISNAIEALKGKQ